MIVSIDSSKLPSREPCGNKFFNLCRLRDHHIKVPFSLCIPKFFLENIFNVKKDKLLAEFRRDLLYIKDLIYPPYIVRSSGYSEDSRVISKAGIHKSIVTFKSPHLVKTIKEVFDSGEDISTLIQPLLNSRVSGITFTNYMNGIMLIESNWGYCKSITDGIIEPDKFFIDRNCENFIIKTLGTKYKMTVLSMDQLREVISDFDHSEEFSLTDSEIQKLTDTCLKIETIFGIPQDIEWTINQENELYILQTRPITSYQHVY